MKVNKIKCENFIVYRKENEFSAWPRNCGVYKYKGDEIVVNFFTRTCNYQTKEEVGHGYEPPDNSSRIMQIRSKDGGKNWNNSKKILTPINLGKGETENINFLSPKEFNFKNPDFMLIAIKNNLFFSDDRGKTLYGPCRLPSFGYDFNWARPDYVVREDGALILFSTVNCSDGKEGKPIAIISKNNGLSWEILSYISSEKNDYMQIMPSGIILPDGKILCAIRCQRYRHGYSFWSECYISEDSGRSWQFLSRINDIGSPCHLLLLKDGRILATYGYRSYPFGIRCSISEDYGKTWKNEFIIRDDGGSWDLGYPVSIQLDSGKILTFYYFNDKNDKIQVDGGVRYIAGSIFEI
ncbi:MAG TPA: sialidase family protein [bacterium]|nr:sialidase family protein [bacterium]HOM26021.1 sialidase family protein [bacterium]